MIPCPPELADTDFQATFRKLSLAELRKRQDLCQQQISLLHQQTDGGRKPVAGADEGMARLRYTEQELALAVDYVAFT